VSGNFYFFMSGSPLSFILSNPAFGILFEWLVCPEVLSDFRRLFDLFFFSCARLPVFVFFAICFSWFKAVYQLMHERHQISFLVLIQLQSDDSLGSLDLLSATLSCAKSMPGTTQ
jgi:hypothetical protein